MKELKRTEKIIPKFVIKNKAKRLVKSHLKFKASKGWFDKFFKKFNIMGEFKNYEKESGIFEVKKEENVENLKEKTINFEKKIDKIHENLIFKQDSVEHVVYFEEK